MIDKFNLSRWQIRECISEIIVITNWKTPSLALYCTVLHSSVLYCIKREGWKRKKLENLQSSKQTKNNWVHSNPLCTALFCTVLYKERRMKEEKIRKFAYNQGTKNRQTRNSNTETTLSSVDTRGSWPITVLYCTLLYCTV